MNLLIFIRGIGLEFLHLSFTLWVLTFFVSFLCVVAICICSTPLRRHIGNVILAWVISLFGMIFNGWLIGGGGA